MAKRMAIRIKVLDRSEYVEISEEMLSNYEIFIRHVMHTFGLDPSQAARMNIFDQNNFLIPVDLFPVVMPQFICSSVYLKIVFTMHDDIGFDLNLEDFLKQNGCKSIFVVAKEACRLGKELDVKDVHYLCEKLVHFMEFRAADGNCCGVQDAADSLVRLMPCINMETLYGRKKGILFNKLNYRKYGRRKLEEPNAIEIVEQASDVINQNVVDQFASLTIEEELASLLFFKTCLIDRDKEILKIKLKQTIAMRQKVLKRRETKFIESFPFYFLSPELILFDYSIRFIGENALIDIWPTLKMDIYKLLTKVDSEDCGTIGFDDVTTSFLMVLRAFSMRKTFERNVDKLLIFSNNVNDCPEDLINKNNSHPYIIAVGHQKNSISNYYIDIEDNLIPVPSEYGFLETFDMFFKCHKVFNIEYNSAIIKLMHLIDYYIFKDKESSEIDVSVTMQKISQKLQLN